MHVEVAFHLAPFLGEQHRQQEAGPEHLAEQREQPRARARPECAGRATVLRGAARPDLDVPVLDLGEAPVEVLLLRVRLGVGEQAIQERRVGLVLPMVLEGVEVGSSAGRHVGKVMDRGTGWRPRVQ